MVVIPQQESAPEAGALEGESSRSCKVLSVDHRDVCPDHHFPNRCGFSLMNCIREFPNMLITESKVHALKILAVEALERHINSILLL